jgi:HSP20 family protein
LAPGADPASFNISMVGSTLTISGEKPRVPGEVKPEAFHREERAAGRFSRSIEIPMEVEQGEGISGQYRNGLLLITLPKSEKAKPKQIKVQVN